MEKITKRVSVRGIETNKSTAGVANVILPLNTDREKYVSDCFRLGTVSIINEFGELYENIRVSKNVMNEISIPETPNKLGSKIVWVNIPKHQIPIVVAIIQKEDEMMNIDENQYSILKSNKGNLSGITVDGEKGNLFLTTNSKDDGGIIKIKVNNNSKAGKFIVEVDGDTKMYSSMDSTIEAKNKIDLIVRDYFRQDKKFTRITIENKEGIEIIDEFGNEVKIIDGKIQIQSKTIEINTAKEQAVLGNELASLLKDLITEISNITTATAIGAQPVINKPIIMNFKNRVDKILSKTVKLD